VLGSAQERHLSLNAVEHDKDRPFRPISIRVRACATGGTAALLQLGLYDLNDHIIATSGPVLIGSIPKTINVRWPDSSDYYPSGAADNNQLVSLTHVCTGTGVPFKNTFILINGTIFFHSGAETFISTCPAANAKTPLASDRFEVIEHKEQ